MAKPWNHPPGKIYRPNLPDETVQKKLEKRKDFGDKWDKIFGKKKLNNIEDNEKEDNES